MHNKPEVLPKMISVHTWIQEYQLKEKNWLLIIAQWKFKNDEQNTEYCVRVCTATLTENITEWCHMK